MTTFDDLVAQLRGARATLLADRERLDGELGRLEAAITALDGATTVATIPRPLAEKPAAVVGGGAPMSTSDKKLPRPTAERVKSSDPEKARQRWAEVFDWVVQAKADGTYSMASMEKRFGNWAKNWRVSCARYGMTLDDPAGITHAPAPAPETPVKTTPPPTGKPVLRCTDCGFEAAVDKADRLDLHCRGTHRRPATTAERTPVAAA